MKFKKTATNLKRDAFRHFGSIVVSCVKYRIRHSSFPRRRESIPRSGRGQAFLTTSVLLDSRLRGNDGHICDTI